MNKAPEKGFDKTDLIAALNGDYLIITEKK